MPTDTFSPLSLSVQLVSQPTNTTCWAASMAMIVGTRDSISIDAAAIADAAGLTTTDGYGWSDIQKAVSQWRLNTLGPACAPPNAWADALRSHGPIWIVE